MHVLLQLPRVGYAAILALQARPDSIHLCVNVWTLAQGLEWCAAAAIAAGRASLAAAITAASADAHLRAGEHDSAAAVLQVQKQKQNNPPGAIDVCADASDVRMCMCS
jgi:hypothetical protein